MALHQKKPEDFALNELNKDNTHQGSPRTDFYLANFKFGIGFWTSVLGDGSGHPFMALTVWTPAGHRVLGAGMFMYKEEFGMDMPSPDEDLNQFMWYIGEIFTPPLMKFLEEKGAADDATGVADQDGDGSIDPWEKVLHLLPTVRFENGRLEFDRAI